VENDVFGVNPVPRMLKDEPAGKTPPPGTTLLIDTEPPTVMLPCLYSNCSDELVKLCQMEASGSISTGITWPGKQELLKRTAKLISG